MPRNSAPEMIQVQATEKKVSTRHSAAWTGLRTVIVPSAAMVPMPAKKRKAILTKSMAASAERGVGGATLGDFGFEPVTDRQQLRLGHDVLAPLLEVVLVDVRLHDRVDRAGLLAEPAEDALEQ